MIKTNSIDTFKSFVDRAASNGQNFEIYLTEMKLHTSMQFTGDEPPDGASVSALLRSQLGEVCLFSRLPIADKDIIVQFLNGLNAYSPINCESITVNTNGIITIE